MLAPIMHCEASLTLKKYRLERRRRSLFALLLLAGTLLWLSACGQTSTSEPAAVDEAGPALAAVGPESVAVLPTPGGTLPPPTHPPPCRQPPSIRQCLWRRRARLPLRPLLRLSSAHRQQFRS